MHDAKSKLDREKKSWREDSQNKQVVKTKVTETELFFNRNPKRIKLQKSCLVKFGIFLPKTREKRIFETVKNSWKQ